jgi:hypothetical protein
MNLRMLINLLISKNEVFRKNKKQNLLNKGIFHIINSNQMILIFLIKTIFD